MTAAPLAEEKQPAHAAVRTERIEPAKRRTVCRRYKWHGGGRSLSGSSDFKFACEHRVEQRLRRMCQDGASFPCFRLRVLLYLAVAGVLFLRLLYGLAVAIEVWQSARPAQLDPSPLTDGLHLRCSDEVSSPVTIGSAIVLPVESIATWDSEKLRVVLAHERSHIRQKDFYLQLLAGVYAARGVVQPAWVGGSNANFLIWLRRSATARDWKRPRIARRTRRFCLNSRPRRAQP